MQTQTLFPLPKYPTDYEFSYKGYPAFIYSSTYSSHQGATGWVYLVVVSGCELPKGVVLSEPELDALVSPNI